jgi:hypothetical protein
LEKELLTRPAAGLLRNPGRARRYFVESERLNLAARTRKVPPLTDMLSESQAALIEQMKESGFDVSRCVCHPSSGTRPPMGFEDVRPLIEHVGANLNNFKQPIRSCEICGRRRRC